MVDAFPPPEANEKFGGVGCSVKRQVISRWPGIVVYRCGPLAVILDMLKDHGKP